MEWLFPWLIMWVLLRSLLRLQAQDTFVCVHRQGCVEERKSDIRANSNHQRLKGAALDMNNNLISITLMEMWRSHTASPAVQRTARVNAQQPSCP